jgi:tetratricopeptide (TPR) repeat protein
MRRHPFLVLAALGLGLCAEAARAQAPPLTLPQASPAASVSQTVGLTEITINYHRPAVNKRKVWGGLVPYNDVWRAGANENTTITFSTPVSVGGKTLPAGTYGLHMLPGDKDWSVMLSSVSTAWGSFSYDAKEDVVRFPATAQPADFEERLEYRFENPTETSVTASLQWEKLRVSFPIAVDTNAVVLDSLKHQLRGLPRFTWQGWNQAAQWCVRNGVDLDQGLAWADQSIKMQATFGNLRTKAEILEKKGDTKAAQELTDRALKIASEGDINLYGYGFLQQKKYDEAIAIFRKNVKDHPQSWNTYDSLGEALAAKGDKSAAIENYGKALSMTTDAVQKKRITDILAGLKA